MTAKVFRALIATAVQRGVPETPRCRHAGECGGCAFQDRAYADQVAAKALALNQLWSESSFPAEVEVVPSPDPYGYRTRMDYVATKGRFGLRKRGKFNYIIELEECHLIPPGTFAAVHVLWQRARELGLPDYNIRSHEGFLRYLVVRCGPPASGHGGQALLVAVTAAGEYELQMEQLAALALAQPGVIGFHWLINDMLTDLSFGTLRRYWGAATLPMRVGVRTLQVGPNSFFQNNVHLLLPLLDAVKEAITVMASNQHRLPVAADLYGGVGTIALHIAGAVDRVVTVESAGESAMLAQQNIALNGAQNVQPVAADVLEFLRAQLPGAFDVVVVDPPRTGLGSDVCGELLRLLPRRIIYVSCNPLTQRDDVAMLQPGYQLCSLRGYDMFPHTPHLETLGVLEHWGNVV